MTTLHSGLCYRKSVCLSSVTFVHPTQGVGTFHNISLPLCTLAILWPPCKILWRSSQGNPFVGGVKRKRNSKTEWWSPTEGYNSGAIWLMWMKNKWYGKCIWQCHVRIFHLLMSSLLLRLYWRGRHYADTKDALVLFFLLLLNPLSRPNLYSLVLPGNKSNTIETFNSLCRVVSICGRLVSFQ